MNTNPALKEATVQAYQTLRSQTPWQHEGTGILHHRVLPFATLAPWLADPTFMALYEQIQSNTLVDIYRCYELWSLAQQARYVEGDVLEACKILSSRVIISAWCWSARACLFFASTIIMSNSCSFINNYSGGIEFIIGCLITGFKANP